jgi:2'-5' RNA ligase
MLSLVQRAAAWDHSETEMTLKKLIPNPKLAKARDEFHIGLDIPKSIGIEIHNWAEEQDWPKGTELEPLEDYHITMLFAQGDGAEGHYDDDWIKHDSHAVTVKGLKEFPPSKERDGLHPIVMLVESDTIHEHHNALAEGALEAGVDPGPYAKDKYAPHMTIGYGPGLPKGLKPPKLTFETAESSVSTPREEDESLTDLLQGSSAGYGCGQIWVNKDEKKVLINVGDGEGDVIDLARALAEKEWPDYDIDIDAEIGFPGDGWKLDPLSAAKPTKQEEHKSAWRIARVRPPYEAELLKFADSWQPKDSPPSGLRERAFEPTDVDCTCKDGHKLDCPCHGLHPTLPTYDDTLEFPDPSSPVGYDYHTDAPRTWMRAETKVAALPTDYKGTPLTFLHASDRVMQPGEMVLPASQTGHPSRWRDVPTYNPDHVYMQDHYGDPYALERHGEHLYVVEPQGSVAPDPEREPERWTYLDEDPSGHAWVAPAARVVRRISVDDAERLSSTKMVPSLRAGEHTDWHFAKEIFPQNERMSYDEADSREYPDALMMPPITMQEPAQGNPHPEKQGCTCPEGLKLTCPVHGMNPDPTQQGYDHTWSIPENAPVGYPQDQPKNYFVNTGAFDRKELEAEGYSPYEIGVLDSLESNPKQWKPGTRGKAIITPEGRSYEWSVEPVPEGQKAFMGGPHHGAVEAMLGLEESQEGQHLKGDIFPNGVGEPVLGDRALTAYWNRPLSAEAWSFGRGKDTPAIGTGINLGLRADDDEGANRWVPRVGSSAIEPDQQKGIGIDHEYSVACDCPGCAQRREHTWHIQSPGTSSEGWGGLPRAEGAVLEDDEDDEHEDDLKGEEVAMPKPPQEIRKKQKEQKDLELVQESKGTVSA